MNELRAVCRNPWCKATFFYTEKDMLNEEAPKQCNKCRSFESELSGGIEWKDQNYEGSRFDNRPHEIKYKVTNFKL